MRRTALVAILLAASFAPAANAECDEGQCQVVEFLCETRPGLACRYVSEACFLSGICPS